MDDKKSGVKNADKTPKNDGKPVINQGKKPGDIPQAKIQPSQGGKK